MWRPLCVGTARMDCVGTEPALGAALVLEYGVWRTAAGGL